MKTYLYSVSGFFEQGDPRRAEILHVLEKVAEGTDTSDLVVAIYLLPGVRQNRGSAFVRAWMRPQTFTAKRGKWAFAKRWGTPSDLPQKFKLIRMRLDLDREAFPKTETDSYDWEFRYATFRDHLAMLFAHELHHYRRYHLGFHPREGEHHANLWALKHVQNLHFDVTGTRLPIKRRTSFRQFPLLKKFQQRDPFATFRKLGFGDLLVISHDPKRQYLDQTVRVLRPIRQNSKRIVIQTSDGKRWRWPMTWLKMDENAAS